MSKKEQGEVEASVYLTEVFFYAGSLFSQLHKYKLDSANEQFLHIGEQKKIPRFFPHRLTVLKNVVGNILQFHPVIKWYSYSQPRQPSVVIICDTFDEL